ncbi:MAG: hypothetical protein EB059_10225 [Alphaproteobacteria bacterium]|nr:hypothetical protein [Alphaproteobacteria bacterium]
MAFGLKVRRDISSAVLRKKAGKERTSRVAMRMLGIANILEGMDRDNAAQSVGMTRQTLRDWVVRYNEAGLNGLRNRAKGHAKRALNPEQEKEIDALVMAGPPGTLVRWRRVDLQKEIEKRFNVRVHERTVGKILERLGFSHMSVRALHPEADSEAQEAFKKTLRITSTRSSPNMQKTRRSSSGFKTKQGLDKKAR